MTATGSILRQLRAREAGRWHLAALADTVGPARLPSAWLAMLAFVLYLPPAIGVARLTPDGIEFIDIARRLADGQGFVLGLKNFLIGDPRVIHDGLEQRAPLYPLLIAPLLGAGFGVTAAQLVNALLVAGSVGLVYAIGAELFGRRVGWLAGLLAATCPRILIDMLPPMSEALTTFLVLLATWLVARTIDAPRWEPFAAAGAALGLAYLTRPTALALAGALIVGALLASTRRRALIGKVAVLLASAAIFVLPITLRSLATKGSLSYSGQTYLYSVRNQLEATERDIRHSLPSASDFILANRDFVLTAIADNAVRYAGDLFLDDKLLLYLAPAWPLALLALARGRYPRAAWPVLLVAGANFVTYASTWSAYQLRYLILTLLPLLPFAVDGLRRLGLARLRLPAIPRLTALHLAVFAVALLWSETLLRDHRGEHHANDRAVKRVGARSYRDLVWTGPAEWVEDESLAHVLDWIEANTQAEDILAGRAPHPWAFFTHRPTLRLPVGLPARDLRGFLIDYRVAYVLLYADDRSAVFRRTYPEALEALANEGVVAAASGPLLIFDTRSLWHDHPDPSGTVLPTPMSGLPALPGRLHVTTDT